MSKMFPKSFLTQVAGSSAMGILEAVLEVYSPELFGQPNRASAANPPLLAEPVVPIEKVMLVPIGLLAAAVSKKAKKQGVKSFAEGMYYYAIPRVVDREIVRTYQASQRGWLPPP